MNILLISDYFPPYIVGGAEISAYYLGVGLSKLGHNVSVLTRYPEKINIKYEGFRAIHSVVYKNKKSIFYDYLRTGILSSADLAKKLENILKKENFDILHAQNWISGYAVMRTKRRIKRFPSSVLSIRDYRYLCPGLYGWCLSDKTKSNCSLLKTAGCVYKHSEVPYLTKNFGLIPYTALRYISCNMLAQSMNAFDAYIANSNFLRGAVLNNLELKIENVHTVHNAIDLEEFGMLTDLRDEFDRRIKILYVGRFDNGKGIEYLIGAIPLIVKHHNNCSFVFVGDGPIKPQIEKLAKKLGISKYITFEGFVPHNNINKYYHKCDIVVVPSVWPEPFGRSVIEAMACGNPIIATEVGGIPEIVEHEKTGLLIKPASLEEIANSIMMLLCNADKRKKMGEMGKKVIKEKYNVEVIAKKTLEIYEDVL